MPLILESHDSLPYIDPEPAAADKEKATSLIARQLSPDQLTTPHPSLAPLPDLKLSEVMLQEVARIGAGRPLQGGVDLTRYEAPDEPSSDSSLDEWRQALRTAYASAALIAGRYTNLALLDEFGKNAWLISNWQAEEILQDLEVELARLKEETENINKARKAAQEHHKAELLGLQEHWKRGLGKILEVQVATDGLRQLVVDSLARSAT